MSKEDIVLRLSERAGSADFVEFMDDGVEKRRIQANRQIDLDAIAEIERLRDFSSSAAVMIALAAKLHPDSPINWGQFEKDALRSFTALADGNA